MRYVSIDVLRAADPDAFDVDCGGHNGYGVVKCNCDVQGKSSLLLPSLLHLCYLGVWTDS